MSGLVAGPFSFSLLFCIVFGCGAKHSFAILGLGGPFGQKSTFNASLISARRTSQKTLSKFSLNTSYKSYLWP